MTTQNMAILSPNWKQLPTPPTNHPTTPSSHPPKNSLCVWASSARNQHHQTPHQQPPQLPCSGHSSIYWKNYLLVSWPSIKPRESWRHDRVRQRHINGIWHVPSLQTTWVLPASTRPGTHTLHERNCRQSMGGWHTWGYAHKSRWLDGLSDL